MAAGAFQLAFVDVKLPGMDGLELLQHLRKWAPQLPCVVVSGYYYDDDEPVHAALESGAISSFISKPFLLTRVREALQVALTPSP